MSKLEKENVLEKDKIEKKENRIVKIITNIPHKKYILIVILVLIVVFFPARKPEILTNHNYSKIQKICDLAMVDAYYHSVASKEVDATKVGKIFGDAGYKKYWIEYDSSIQFGIDAKKVKIKKSLFSNKVKVYIPDAVVLNRPVIDSTTTSKPITDKGFLTTIDTAEKTEAISNEQEELYKKACKDTELLDLAKERAKSFFKNYIEGIGKESGTNYEVVFVD